MLGLKLNHVSKRGHSKEALKNINKYVNNMGKELLSPPSINKAQPSAYFVRYSVTVTSSWAWWHLKSQASQLFAQLFVQAQIKKISKPHVSGPCAGYHQWPVVSPHKGPVPWKMFLFDDVIMSVFSAGQWCYISGSCIRKIMRIRLW